nr:efflux RND transporter periplasmic adaptor subunit [Roseomonas acroporae]
MIRLDERQIRAAGIDTVKVEPEAGTTEVVLPGTVQVPPYQLRVVAAPAAGLIEALLVNPDESVQAGQPLARLRSTELVEQQRLFLEAVSQQTLARERLRRDETLFRERIIAERRLLTTRADAAFAEARLAEREQMLSLFGMAEADIAALRRTRRISPSLTVTAPAEGVVLQRQASAGERVAQSAPLFTVAQMQPLWVQIQVPLAQASAVEAAAQVSIPNHGASGVVLRVGRSVDAATQSTSATAEISQGAETLRPGEAVQVALQLPQNGTPQWRVPAGAVVRHRGRSWVFVRVPEGFAARPVTVVTETGQTTSMRAPLRATDEVAARGILTLLAELSEMDGA